MSFALKHSKKKTTMKNYSDEDMVNTPWCYMPPEMHFDSVQDLCDAVWAFQLSRLQDELAHPEMADFLLPPVNKFEKVKNNKGKYILIPTAIDNSFVFRGQQDFYEKCLPTLYRSEKSEEDELIERLRSCEFETYLRQMPQVEDFEQRNFQIDYLGLSQHYGLQTEVMDLTNSLDVALFFATCNMNEDGKTYSPQTEDKEYIGYIYAVITREMADEIKTLFDGKLSAIGMQPFYRPGNQRGFGLHLEKGETLTGLLYSFSYTKEDSERIYKSFENGDELWHEDDISRVAREIKTTMTFSYEAMNLCFKRYYKKCKSKRREMKQRLQAKGCVFQKDGLWKLSVKDLVARKENYEKNGGFTKLVDIVQRKTMDDDGKMRECVDTHFLTCQWMIQFPISGCKAPEDYDSPFQFSESKDKFVWGFSLKGIKQEDQTKPNDETGKVDKWTGDWKSLKIDYKRHKKLAMELVRVPKKG